jgi:hypothetical protein
MTPALNPIDGAAAAPLRPGPVPGLDDTRAFERLLGERPGGAGEPGAAEIAADPGTAAAPPMPSPAAGPVQLPVPADVRELYDLVARMVEQLYVSPPDAAHDPTLVMRLDPTLFPGTELLLARDARGWRLEALAASAEARRALVDGAAALEARFDARGLGSIRVEPADSD